MSLKTLPKVYYFDFAVLHIISVDDVTRMFKYNDKTSGKNMNI